MDIFLGALVGDCMGFLTLQDIFCASYPEYECTHALPAHVRKAARAVMQCRTAALGGHVRSARISRPSAGSPSSRPGSWPVTIIM